MTEFVISAAHFALALGLGALACCRWRLNGQGRMLLAAAALLMLGLASVNGALAWRDNEGDARGWVLSDGDRRRLVEVTAELDAVAEDVAQIWQ